MRFKVIDSKAFLSHFHNFLHFVEVNIMWAGHQTHHSTEDYNLTTALRQSTFHRYIAWVKYNTL